MGTFRFLARSFTSLLAPDLCRLCHLPLLEAARHPVCDSCLAQAAPAQPDLLCGLCGESLGMESARAADLSHTAAGLCAACSQEAPKFVRATAYGTYGDHLRELIHLLKYDHLTSLATPLGAMLADAIQANLAEDAPPELTVVAVPLFRRKRPFNQSELLAGEAMRAIRRRSRDGDASLPPVHFQQRHQLLRRVRSTGGQFTFSRMQRRKNIRGAFAVSGDVSSLHILLVDDVYTTGATAAECTRVLLAGGAASVRVVTLARAQRDTAIRWRPPVLQASAVPQASALPHLSPAQTAANVAMHEQSQLGSH